MRKQNRDSYAWMAIIGVSIFLCFQHLPKQGLLQQTDNIQKVETMTIDTTPVDLSNSTMTSVYPDLVEKTVDSKEEKSIPYNEVQTKRIMNVAKMVQGAFFHSDVDNDKYMEPKSWLTVYPARGRLGNQMFQLASLIGIAHKLGFRPFISSATYDIDSVFDVPKLQSKNIDLNEFNKYQEENVSTFAERDITHYTDLSVLKNDVNWTIDGYLQSYKHFEHINEDIKALFKFRRNVIAQAQTFIQSNTVPGSMKVGIHVRRGDFINDYHRGLGRVIPGLDYFKRAMDFYRSQYKDITFFVFSNDISWCRDNIYGNNQKVIFSPYTHPGYDLAIMSLCDHMILSVGTFGWWGGWLAGGSVVYYQGYPKPGSDISKYFVQEDFYPANWTGLT